MYTKTNKQASICNGIMVVKNDNDTELYVSSTKKTRNGKTYYSHDKSELTGFHEQTRHWKPVGEMEHEIICPVGKEYFDKKNPVMPTSAKSCIPYDEEFYETSPSRGRIIQDKDKRYSIVRTPIVRNYQVLAYFLADEDFNYSKCDGGQGCEYPTFQNWYCKDRIKYETAYADHSSENDLDAALTSEEVEENKMRFNTE